MIIAMCRGVFLSGFLVFFSMSGAWASTHPNGEKLLYFCNATTGDLNGAKRFSQCEKLVSSVRNDLRNSKVVYGLKACIPKNISNLQLIFTGITWLEKNPKSLHKGSEEILARAFAIDWPCKG